MRRHLHVGQDVQQLVAGARQVRSLESSSLACACKASRWVGGASIILTRGSERERAWRRRRRRSKASAHFERSALPLENAIN